MRARKHRAAVEGAIPQGPHSAAHLEQLVVGAEGVGRIVPNTAFASEPRGLENPRSNAPATCHFSVQAIRQHAIDSYRL